MHFSPDGNQLAVAGIGVVTNVDGFVGPCRLEVWDWRGGKRTYAGQDKHKAILNDVQYDPVGRIVSGGGGDSGGLLAFWDVAKPRPIHKAKPKGHLQRLALSADARSIYACGHGGFQVWRA